jgi:hypothetical protein
LFINISFLQNKETEDKKKQEDDEKKKKTQKGATASSRELKSLLSDVKTNKKWVNHHFHTFHHSSSSSFHTLHKHSSSFSSLPLIIHATKTKILHNDEQ